MEIHGVPGEGTYIALSKIASLILPMKLIIVPPMSYKESQIRFILFSYITVY